VAQSSDHQLVHHLQGGRDHAGGDDGGHRPAAGIDGVVDGEEGLDALGQAGDLRHDLGADAEGAFAAHEHAGEVVAQRIGGSSAQLHHLAVGLDHGHAQDVVGGDPVLEAVGAAGILGHVAAQGRGLLAGGIGQELIAHGRQGVAQLQVEQARLHPGPQAGAVHFQDPVHADHLDHQAALEGDGAAGEVGAPAPGHEGASVPVADFHHPGHFLGGVDERHGFGPALLKEPIILVELEIH
jgi:hypothetical protein